MLADLFDNLLPEAQLVGIVLLLNRVDLFLELSKRLLSACPVLRARRVLRRRLRSTEDDRIEGRPQLKVKYCLEAVGVLRLLRERIAGGGQLHRRQEV